MSIVALKKCLLIGLLREQEEVLEELQALGIMHLEPLRSLEDSPRASLSGYLRALRFLTACPRKLRPVEEDPNFDAEALVESCLKLEERMRQLQDRCDFLRGRIRALEPWGEFHLPPEEALAGFKLWFYQIPTHKLKDLPKTNLVWQVVHKTPKMAYLVVIAKEEPQPDLWPLPRVHTGRVPLTRLKFELARTEAELEDLMLERERLTRFLTLFRRHLGELEDYAQRRQAALAGLKLGELFALQGWVPVTELQALVALAQRLKLGLILEDPRADELPPTLLSNPKPFATGEALVRFYQTPSYYDWDPSSVVFISFIAFFALMLADAGYALWLLGLSFALRRRLPLEFKTLSLWSAWAALVWGILTGSYFGHPPPPFLAPLRLIVPDDFAALLTFSVGIGLFHLSLANLIRAWQDFHLSRPWLAPLGWVIAGWGGFGFWQTQAPFWLALAGGGLSVVVFGSSKRQVKGWVEFILRLLEGLKELTKATRFFGDVLSYLRLAALALAGSSLASTCNAMAAEVRGIVGLGVLESVLVLLIGHGINGGLSVIGAVIHGLRLNCIEFFGWGLSGEGRPFRAFAKGGQARWKA
jgi:V/A-type H+-transporting ATPase subunit I